MSIIVISVGTSLITNNREVNGLKDHFGTVTSFLKYSRPESVKKLSFSFENGKLSQVTPDNLYGGLYDFSREFFEKYMVEDHIKRNIGLRKNGGDCLPAEISSLYLYYYDKEGNLREEFEGRLKGGSDSEFTERDRIILLTTDTADAVYCARMLEQMISNVSLFSAKCKVTGIEKISNLDVYDPEKYAAESEAEQFEAILGTGLGQLFAYFDNNFGNAENSKLEDRIMIRTGGYKEFSADLKMLAMQFGFRSYYLFERSMEMIVVNQLSWPRDFSQVALCSRRRG